MAQESWNRDKEETGCKVPKGLILCANNCGLFGSPATMNLCSKCYRDLKHSFPQAGGDSAAAFRSDAVPALALNEERAGPSSSSGAISSQKPLVTEATRQTTNRCTTCRKKVGLTGFRCRCGHMFCGLHRYSDKHGCSFDYKAFGRAAIAKANPVVKADKVIRF